MLLEQLDATSITLSAHRWLQYAELVSFGVFCCCDPADMWDFLFGIDDFSTEFLDFLDVLVGGFDSDIVDLFSTIVCLLVHASVYSGSFGSLLLVNWYGLDEPVLHWARHICAFFDFPSENA